MLKSQLSKVMEHRNKMGTNIESHDQAVINQWPKIDDPNEDRIVGVIRDKLLSTVWAKNAIKQTADIQLAHLKASLKHIDDPQFIHDNTQKVLAELARVTNSKIVEGKEYVESLPKGRPILLLTNHLGVYKLNSWPIDELREKTGLTGPVQPLFYPFPFYFAAVYPIAKELNDNLYIASFEYPGQLGKILRAAGSIEVPPEDTLSEGKSRTEVLIDSTRRFIETHPNAVIVSFPEGGTTGKRNEGSPYDLEKFHTGSYVIARELGLTILPVAQYFNPESGLELRVFWPVKLPTNANNDDLEKAANQNWQEELAWVKSKESQSK